MTGYRPSIGLVLLVVAGGLTWGFLLRRNLDFYFMTEKYGWWFPIMAKYCSVPAGGILAFFAFWLFVRYRQP